MSYAYIIAAIHTALCALLPDSTYI